MEGKGYSSKELSSQEEYNSTCHSSEVDEEDVKKCMTTDCPAARTKKCMKHPVLNMLCTMCELIKHPTWETVDIPTHHPAQMAIRVCKARVDAMLDMSNKYPVDAKYQGYMNDVNEFMRDVEVLEYELKIARREDKYSEFSEIEKRARNLNVS